MASEIQLSPDQQGVHDHIVAWSEKKAPLLRIGGFAGCGKTFTVAQTVKTLRDKNKKIRIAFCCFTGKAAFVLRTKLQAVDMLTGDEYVGTIHGLIYTPVIEDGEVIDWKRTDAIEADLIIVDEVSMVNATIWEDLRSFKIPILAVGDHGQLPPIGDALALMKDPDHTLTKIHRQAEGNPIIACSVMAREEGHIPEGIYTGTNGGYVKKVAMSAARAAEGVKDLEILIHFSTPSTTFTPRWTRC